MGFGEWHGIWTIIILVLFLAIVGWSFFSRRAKKQFDEAANSIFEEDKASSVKESDKPESKKDE
ncbi:CcoQ/FixQ family Cbb3-type cytochrome c oxidase assembly chaperone [Idiomarina sp. OT37-5b]|jgi:cytochrome c oxidase cbb3-type subunit 4|uniref:CcoQ/FixQ family Cbb3-type cytochrome c oxidase assembly chaperone n=1 Tax=Idiomarina aquatica TaxID=1327752 RepID=A0AA94EEM6_9GAMM|nr:MULTISPECIES: cbb3-type cytochrome c oxidase subunit 3 [Idiomarina]AVJ55944.1 CcoQ/FixQ family Cbb3-type cytochrome c oxidase assembly chaperone [Idiomarina sp. OT37-5b]RUO43527.1 CcoQ/FixQ family Cbb3-type cytochrome c oxidase assembly chaperone [Idiomarina aquatica]|tara:strand:+ start:76 stop:267 length:192 start_codon:yes stop_codon:yes gene_type:complete